MDDEKTLLPETADYGLILLRLQLATITVRLESLNHLIDKKNKNVKEIKEVVNKLINDGNKIKKELSISPSKQKNQRLLEVYTRGLEITQHLLNNL